jgi:hypothetical protein
LLRAWNAAMLVRSAVSGITGGTKEDMSRRRANEDCPGLLREHGGDVCLPFGDHQAQKNSAPPNGERITPESHVEPVAVALAGGATGPTNTQRSRR